MKKLFKGLLVVSAILTLIIMVAVVYLNFIYLPQKVKSTAKEYLQAITKGQMQAKTIQYIPFKGLKLYNVTIFSKTKKAIFNLDNISLRINLWPLLLRRELSFRMDMYPHTVKRPLVFTGVYQIKKQKLDLNFKIHSNLFLCEQTIAGRLRLFTHNQEKTDIELSLSSADVAAQGTFYLKDQDLQIEKFSAKVLQSTIDLIGDVQNLSNPSLNVYGDLRLNLQDFKDLNPRYVKLSDKLNLNGELIGKIYIAKAAENLEIGLKMGAEQITVERIKAKDISIIAKMENKEVALTKFYAKLYSGELNLQGRVNLNSPAYPATLDINMFNLDLNKMLKDISGKGSIVHGHLFTLGNLRGPLQDLRQAEGKIWVSVNGANILQLPAFTGITDILRLPQLRSAIFKEAGGNFSVANQQAATNDFKISGNTLNIYYKGYIDFAGNLSFDVAPVFSQDFLLGAPDLANILGIFMDSTGNFLGEIKLKGSIKKAHYTFKPFSAGKFFPEVIEKGLQELFKFKNKEE